MNSEQLLTRPKYCPMCGFTEDPKAGGASAPAPEVDLEAGTNGPYDHSEDHDRRRSSWVSDFSSTHLV